MDFMRTLKHLFVPGWLARRGFDASVLAAIEVAVADSEARHRAELRFVVEGPLPFHVLRLGLTARQRATALFASLGVWDTEENNGVLIYVQTVDRRVEILADRGIARKVDPACWAGLCRSMESAFAAGQWRSGALGAIAEATELLVAHYPAGSNNPNELKNRPLMM